MLRQFGRLITFGALTAVLLLGLGGVPAQTQQPQDLTVKNLTVTESLTVAGLATLNQGLEVVGIIRSKGSPSLGNAAQLILDSSGVEQGRTYKWTATLEGLLELRDETAGKTLLTLDRNGLLRASLDASSITSGTLSLSRLPLGDLDNRYAPRSHVHDTTRANAIFTQDGTRWLFSDRALNTFLGREAGINNTPDSSCCGGWRNTAVGRNALSNNTTGASNTAVGYAALDSNTTGCCNTAVGREALRDNTTGWNNTAVGYWALRDNTTGSGNTAVGGGALYSNTTGSYNTAVGEVALQNNTTGCCNTAVGWEALNNNTTGRFNTAVGYRADVASGGLVNATAIGYKAVVCCSNTIRLGNEDIRRIEAEVDISVTSDVTRKENLLPLDGEMVLEKLSRIPIYSWNFIGQDPQKFRHYGPSSQDFFAAFGHDGLGTIGDERTINTLDFVGVLASGVQALYRRNRELEQELAQQAQELQALKAQLQEVLERLEALEGKGEE